MNMNKLFQFVSDGDGSPSTMRLAVLLIVVPIMMVWTILSIKAGQLIDLDAKWLGLIAAALAAKTGQSFAEKDSPAPGAPVKPADVIPLPPAAVTALLILFSVGLLFATGCKSVAPGQPSGALSKDTNGIVYVGSWKVKTNYVYNAIKIAATIGTQQGVRADTNSVAYFRVGMEVVNIALQNGQYDPTQLQQSFSILSVNEVRDDPNVQNGIEIALALYQGFYGAVVAQQITDASPYLLPALTALRDGIAAGLPAN